MEQPRKRLQPEECYSTLQEMKPKKPEKEPREKLLEILKLYNETQDILENVLLEMDLKNYHMLYGMTKLTVQDRLSEVVAEKMQIEDYIGQSSVVNLKDIKPYQSPNPYWSEQTDHLDKSPPLIDSSVPIQHIMFISHEFSPGSITDNNKRGLSLAEISRNFSGAWFTVNLQHIDRAWGPNLALYAQIFQYLVHGQYCSKIFISTHNGEKLFGLKMIHNVNNVFRPTDPGCLDRMGHLSDNFSNLLKNDKTIKSIEIYALNSEYMPSIRVEVEYDSLGDKQISVVPC
jgi:hypothetical protein